MRLLSLSLAIVLAGLAGAILVGGAMQWPLLAGAVALVLPSAGFAALLQGRAPPELGVVGWSLLVIFGAPLWIDRGAALESAGLADLDAVLPSPHRVVEETEAEPPVSAIASLRDLPPPPVDHDSEDLVVLPYEGTTRSMMLSVTLESEAVLLETEMVFDTGATLTTLSPYLVKALNVDIPDDAPTIQLQTANGVRESRLLLLDTLWLGGMPVQGVTVSVCDNCGSLNGLIGLNVSSMFRVEVDQQQRELTFHPEGGNRHLDISHWLSHSLVRGRGGLSVTTTNRSSRTVRGAVLEGQCEQSVRVSLPEMPPGGQAEATFSEPLTCDRPRLVLIEAVW